MSSAEPLCRRRTTEANLDQDWTRRPYQARIFGVMAGKQPNVPTDLIRRTLGQIHRPHDELPDVLQDALLRHFGICREEGFQIVYLPIEKVLQFVNRRRRDLTLWLGGKQRVDACYLRFDRIETFNHQG
jgi:hypothetical protein